MKAATEIADGEHYNLATRHWRLAPQSSLFSAQHGERVGLDHFPHIHRPRWQREVPRAFDGDRFYRVHDRTLLEEIRQTHFDFNTVRMVVVA